MVRTPRGSAGCPALCRKRRELGLRFVCRCSQAARVPMSSDIFARVHAFVKKADELADKGHVLRAAENYGRGAEAARALSGADNLVTVYLQLQQGAMMNAYAAVAPEAETAPHVLAPYRAEFIALLSGVVAALERRREAGTLLESKCSAAEEAWRAGYVQRENAGFTAAEAASVAALCGYEQFLRAGAVVLGVFHHCGFFAAECPKDQFYVQHASNLIMQPRGHAHIAMGSELSFADALRNAAAEAGENGLNPRGVELLDGIWQELHRSGVLQERRAEACTGMGGTKLDAIAAAIAKSVDAEGLRSCALPGCGAKEAHPTHFKSCAACRAVVYCCREHQVEGWPGHKKACKAALKAAAAADEAGPSGA